jgi:hypothetical protein
MEIACGNGPLEFTSTLTYGKSFQKICINSESTDYFCLIDWSDSRKWKMKMNLSKTLMNIVWSFHTNEKDFFVCWSTKCSKDWNPCIGGLKICWRGRHSIDSHGSSRHSCTKAGLFHVLTGVLCIEPTCLYVQKISNRGKKDKICLITGIAQLSGNMLLLFP